MTFRGATLFTSMFARIFITEHNKFKLLLDVPLDSAFPHVCYKKISLIVHAIQTYRIIRGIAPFILNLDTSWR
jgi:hypothetical protein